MVFSYGAADDIDGITGRSVGHAVQEEAHMAEAVVPVRARLDFKINEACSYCLKILKQAAGFFFEKRRISDSCSVQKATGHLRPDCFSSFT